MMSKQEQINRLTFKVDSLGNRVVELERRLQEVSTQHETLVKSLSLKFVCTPSTAATWSYKKDDK